MLRGGCGRRRRSGSRRGQCGGTVLCVLSVLEIRDWKDEAMDELDHIGLKGRGGS